MRLRLGKPKLTAEDYADAVLSILEASPVGTIGAWRETDRSVIRASLVKHFTTQFTHLELIVDSGGSANWRLKTHCDQPGRVRLADYRMSQIGKPEDPRVVDVNAKLSAIGVNA